MNAESIVLLTIDAYGGKISSKIRLNNIITLCGFDVDTNEVIQRLESYRLINSYTSEDFIDGVYRTSNIYRITDNGKKYASHRRNTALADTIHKVINDIGDARFMEISVAASLYRLLGDSARSLDKDALSSLAKAKGMAVYKRDIDGGVSLLHRVLVGDEGEN